jgi:hypothetical protein
MRKNIAEYLNSILLISIGVVGLLIGVLDFFGWDTSLVTTKSPYSIILVTLGLLATSIGIEKIGSLKHYEKRINNLEMLVASSQGGQRLIGAEEIYGTAIRLSSTATESIRSYTTGNSIKTPVNWAKSVSTHLQTAKRIGNRLNYETVIALDFEDLPSNFINNMNERFNYYERKGIRERVSLNLLNMKPPIGLDLVIFDRNHVMLGFTPAKGEEQLMIAILFEHQPKIAIDFADWFDKVALPKSIDYQEWHKRNESS